MAQTIRRKPKGVRRQARTQGAKQQVRKARQKSNSLVDALMRVLPFTEEQLHRAFLTLIIVGVIGLAWLLASVSGLTALAGQQIAASAADAGFEVRRVEVRGVERMNELKVYERVLGERDRAMPLVDLDGLRANLMELDWVGDARVSRQLPDTLVIDIVEREPHAALRKPGRWVLIDQSGHLLEPIPEADAKAMLRISGMGAQERVEDLTALLDAAPALRPQVAEAEWIGNRRWNLTFKTGQVLRLPQGEDESAAALINFARLDGVNRLLGGEVASFDMRIPDRVYLKVPGRAENEAMSTQGGT